MEARPNDDVSRLNRSRHPNLGDYIELNDLVEPLDQRYQILEELDARNDVDDLSDDNEEYEVCEEIRMGDLIVREPFCSKVAFHFKHFEGVITLNNVHHSVTYLMPGACTRPVPKESFNVQRSVEVRSGIYTQ
ncbi:hypothetical protein Tco_1217386 [Tanacetum coccineum]